MRRNFRIVGVMEPDLGAARLRRYKFVWRYDFTKRKPWVQKLRKIPGLPNEFIDLEQFDLEHLQTIKTIFAITAAVDPGNGITLRTTDLRVM